MRKRIRRGYVGLCALCVVVWSLMIGAAVQLPDQFSVAEGSQVALDGALAAVDIRVRAEDGQSSMQTASRTGSGRYTASAKLFGIFPLKDVAVQVTDARTVVIGGRPFGIKMYTDGVLVVGMADVDTPTGAYNPAKSAGIKTGDVIVSIDGTKVTTNEQVAELVERSGGKTMTFCLRRDNIEFSVHFYPARQRAENSWKAGLWVRDSSAGIGMLTFYDPTRRMYAGLGHAVCDVDTGEVLPEGSKGELVFTSIDKEAFPLLRYRTRDICVLTREKCSCGRTLVKMCKPMGRSDDMLIIRGVNVFPSQIETVLLNHGYPANYQIIVDRVKSTDSLDVQVEMTAEMFTDNVGEIERRQKELVDGLRSMLGLAAKVTLVAPKSIVRSEGKAVRVIDKRKI